jgi:hypothetical protein
LGVRERVYDLREHFKLPTISRKFVVKTRRVVRVVVGTLARRVWFLGIFPWLSWCRHEKAASRRREKLPVVVREIGA